MFMALALQGYMNQGLANGDSARESGYRSDFVEQVLP